MKALGTIVICLALAIGFSLERRASARFAASPHRSFVVCARTTNNQRPHQVVTAGGSDDAFTLTEGFHEYANHRYCTDLVWLGRESDVGGYRGQVRVFGYGLSEVTIRYAVPRAEGGVVILENPLLLDPVSDYYSISLSGGSSDSGIPIVTPGLVTHPEQIPMP